jgi:hypothetical protein
LAHKASRINFCAGCNDLGLSDTFLLRSRRQRSGDLGAENDILDQDTFNGNTPFVGNVADNLSNLEGDGLALSYDTLNCASTNNMPQGGLSTFDERLA